MVKEKNRLFERLIDCYLKLGYEVNRKTFISGDVVSESFQLFKNGEHVATYILELGEMLFCVAQTNQPLWLEDQISYIHDKLRGRLVYEAIMYFGDDNE